MMLPTHVLMGGLISSSMLFIAPEYEFAALTAAVMGSILPDLDMVLSHRKTFHYPFYFTLPAILAVVAAAVYPVEGTVFAAFFLLGAAVHSLSDIFGGDLGTRPWERNDDRGVYHHRNGEWISPRRWIPYDGSPQDFLASFLLAIPLLLLHTGWVEQLVLVTVAVAFVYMLVRKRIVKYQSVFDRIVARVPFS